MRKEPCVYLITCTETGEKYVGSSNYFSKRFREHKYWLSRGKHHNSRLQDAWDEHGEKAFQLSVLERVDDPNILFKREQFWIDTIKPEFNIVLIVEEFCSGLKRTSKTKERLSQARKLHHARLIPEQKEQLRENIKKGRQQWWNSLTEEEQQEHIRKISNPHTEETKRILSKKSRENSAKHWQGKKRSPETIEKMRLAKQKEWDRTKLEREQEKRQKRLEFEAGMEQREKDRIEKLRIANTGKTLSQEQRDHLRDVALAQQQDPEYRAKHHAAVVAAMKEPEVLQRLSDSHKGKKLSEEQKRKIGLAHKGKPKSDEMKRKLSESQKERWKRRKEQLNNPSRH